MSPYEVNTAHQLFTLPRFCMLQHRDDYTGHSFTANFPIQLHAMHIYNKDTSARPMSRATGNILTTDIQKRKGQATMYAVGIATSDLPQNLLATIFQKSLFGVY